MSAASLLPVTVDDGPRFRSSGSWRDGRRGSAGLWRSTPARASLPLRRPLAREVLMRRREVIAGLGCTMAWPLGVRAQQPERTRRIGVLANNPPSTPVTAPFWAAFYAGLNERGWVEGRNLLIEGRYAAGRTERF